MVLSSRGDAGRADLSCFGPIDPPPSSRRPPDPAPSERCQRVDAAILRSAMESPSAHPTPSARGLENGLRRLHGRRPSCFPAQIRKALFRKAVDGRSLPLLVEIAALLADPTPVPKPGLQQFSTPIPLGLALTTPPSR